jgi:hypothetical protein
MFEVEGQDGAKELYDKAMILLNKFLRPKPTTGFNDRIPPIDPQKAMSPKTHDASAEFQK